MSSWIWSYCIDIGCHAGMKLWDDMVAGGYWIQHGDNPEARLFIPYTVAQAGPATNVVARNYPNKRVREWLDSIHKYIKEGIPNAY